MEGSGLSPSFSCYSSSSDTSTSAAIAKVIHEEQQAARFHEFGDFDENDFEFSLVLSDNEVATEENDSRGWTLFPVFNRDLLVKEEVIAVKRQESSSSSCSSSEADEAESPRSKTYCVWRPKADSGSSPSMTKCKKSSSTGSGSKRWSIRCLLRRSNSEGKEPMALSIPTPKQRRNSGEVSKVVGRLKAQTPVHEQFYVKRRAENEIGKRKSFLPYRQVGMFTNVNTMGKMLPF